MREQEVAESLRRFAVAADITVEVEVAAVISQQDIYLLKEGTEGFPEGKIPFLSTCHPSDKSYSSCVSLTPRNVKNLNVAMKH